MKDTIPDSKAFWAIGLGWGILRFLVKWSLIIILVLGLIRALIRSPEGFVWFSWLPFIQSPLVGWVAQNWALLAITWILWQLLSLSRRLETLESRSDSEAAFIGAMMNYVGASDVQYSDELKRKGRPFKALVYDEIVKSLLRVIAGRGTIEMYNSQLLHETRFVRGSKRISLKKDIEAVIKQLHNNQQNIDP
ncbi:MAG: hypothetical protein L0Z68_05860 [Gammaproteobacteria bacterium]|nr:hypothetical protein [Gammaproteobacteria bacterium]